MVGVGLMDEVDDATLVSWEERLSELQRRINRLQAEQAELVARLDLHQIAWSEGSRTTNDWLTARLDVSPQVASRLRALAFTECDEVAAKVESGEWSIDRASWLDRLAKTGLSWSDLEFLGESESLGRLAAMWEKRRRQDCAESEVRFEDRYLVIQPSVDFSAHRFWGMAVGSDGEAIALALARREDQLPAYEGENSGQSKLDALASLCLDSLTGTEAGGREVIVAEVLVDAALAGASTGEAGATFVSGVKAAPTVLEEILCHGKVRLSIEGLNQVFYSDMTEVIPPAIRTLVRNRDLGQCTIDGCRSRYRLQIHHIVERKHGGSHHPGNLTLLCWFHHHIAIHQRGMRIDPDSPPGRLRLYWPEEEAERPPWTVALT